MSLISEALKEAQRSHSAHMSAKNQTSIDDAFFPYPEGRKAARSSKGLLFGASAAVVLMLAATIVVKARDQRLPVRAQGYSPPVIATSAVVVARAPAANSQAAPVRLSGEAKPLPKSTAVASLPVRRSKLKVASTPPRVANTPSLPPDTSQPINGASSGVRVVIDAAATAPSDSLFKQAYAEQVRRNFDGAKELYERAIALPHASAATFNDYGVLLMQNGNALGASQMFSQALTRDDKDVDAWVNLGDSYNAMGHHGEAMSAYTRAGQLDVSSATVKIRLADEYQSIGDTASARRTYGEALEQAPKDPNVHYRFGMFLQAQHDYRGAIREYQAFVDLAPGKYSADNIAAIRDYIAKLRSYAS